MTVLPIRGPEFARPLKFLDRHQFRNSRRITLRGRVIRKCTIDQLHNGLMFARAISAELDLIFSTRPKSSITTITPVQGLRVLPRMPGLRGASCRSNLGWDEPMSSISRTGPSRGLGFLTQMLRPVFAPDTSALEETEEADTDENAFRLRASQ
jgi:hypothetical protein